jgi:Fur family ferric uptake transcriptional regulator
MSCHNDALDQLREAGFRLTPQRAMVLDVVYHNSGHLTADEVFERVRLLSPYVDLSTIYRTLVFLKQNGLIGELRLEGGPARFEAVRLGHEHHHAVCSDCGRMLEIDPADLSVLDSTLRQKYGFEVHLVHLTLSGLCAACAASSAQRLGAVTYPTPVEEIMQRV